MEGFDRYLDSGLPIVHPIAGQPVVSVFIDPRTPQLGLRVHDTAGERLHDPKLQHVVTRRTWHEGQPCLEVAITAPTLFRDAYVLLCGMADRMQIDNMRPAEALRVTLRKLSSLLRPNDALSVEREVGLLGELLALGGLIVARGPAEAVDAWRGGSSEEHDFGLRAIDVEVKTTRSETRVHWIESLTQLVNTGERPLWLLSHQLTPAGVGAGIRLPELIGFIRHRVGEGAPRDRFEVGLAGAGWVDDFEAGCITHWTKRTCSQAYLVIDGFPRLTPELLTDAGVDLAHLSEVNYRVDLSGLPSSNHPPEELQAAIRFEGRE